MNVEEISGLKEAIDKVEVVDGHAHNLVAIDSSFPFLRGFSEAAGDALSFAHHTLSFKRSLREIGELYGCANSVQAVEQHRKSLGLESFTSLCFKAGKIGAVLIDDGLILDKRLTIEWHKSFLPFVGRILRIERLAEEILDNGLHDDGASWTLDNFTKTFLGSLNSVASEVVGFKSIAAYRSGLEINTNVSKQEAEEGLAHVLRAGSPVRITDKNFIDYVFTCCLEVSQRFDLPIQLHTGFGDTDLDLRLANPLHLRAVLEDARFSKCRFVLLHAAYPYSREASYLASVYPQVYLDFGLAVPKLSHSGMVTSVKELLDLAPLKKLMFSSDGYAFPETFYLGAKKSREVIYAVLSEACINQDLSIPDAIEAANDILARNALDFYKIKAKFESCTISHVAPINPTLIEQRASEDAASFVRVLWVDTSGQHRCRVVPSNRFQEVVVRNGIGLTFACMGMISAVDGPAIGSNLTATGEIRLMPDLKTRKKIPWMEKEEFVLADMHLQPGVQWEYCPRDVLRKMSKLLKDEFDLEIRAGFENEFVLLKNLFREGKEDWVPIDSASYCSTAGYDAASPLLHEICDDLRCLNIEIEQLHKEAGKGQFEIALGHCDSMTAADNLIYARETIKAVARKNGLLATFMPKFALNDIGSGNHVHISLCKEGTNVFMASDKSCKYGISTIGQQFMAGVLYHLPALLAFSAPLPNSYDRIKPNTWSGAYQCWGKENREAALRTACPPGIGDGFVSNFEIKSFDATANPYLGLAAIIAAGIDGLRRQLPLPEPVETDPSLDVKLNRLPENLSESVEALEKDKLFEELMGKKLLVAVKAVRKGEIEFYSMNPDAYKMLIHRY